MEGNTRGAFSWEVPFGFEVVYRLAEGLWWSRGLVLASWVKGGKCTGEAGGEGTEAYCR